MVAVTEALTGGCQCGAVRYRLAHAPKAPAICHCRMCQKAGGGPFMAFGGVPMEDFAWMRGAPATFKSSDLATRYFCALCGTPLAYKQDASKRISATLGSLDDPAAAPPREQLGVEARLPWAAALATLPDVRTLDWMAKRGIETAGSRQAPDRD
ncbi:MAG: GFA family protein [Hyphomicrobiales bacterium]|nr:GFA family protein [Hyphomicrobiales bacterium]MDE2016186.1 GFA family protein [Hyphomicrobiales bacterium]